MVILSTASRRLAEFHGYKGRRYPGQYNKQTVLIEYIINSLQVQTQYHRPAAPCPAQDPAQEAGAAAHLRPGRGVAEDWSEEVRVPAPGHAEIPGTEEDCSEDKSTQFVIAEILDLSCD